MFVQGLLTARLGEKAEALRLLRQADGYGFPPLDSPLMALAADCLFELQEYGLATQAYREIVKSVAAERRGPAAAGRLAATRPASSPPPRRSSSRRCARRPRCRTPTTTLGAVLFEQKRVDEARTHLERELAADPRCVGCMAKLAHLAYLKGDDRQCESWLAKAAALDPDDLETNLVYGMLANRAGRYDQAIQLPHPRGRERRPAPCRPSTSSRSPTSGAGTPTRRGSTRRSTTGWSRRRRPARSGCAGSEMRDTRRELRRIPWIALLLLPACLWAVVARTDAPSDADRDRAIQIQKEAVERLRDGATAGSRRRRRRLRARPRGKRPGGSRP